LQVDDHKRGPTRIYVVEDMQLATALHYAVDGPLRHREIMHGDHSSI